MNSSVSIFDIKKMDCPSEERLIRLALEGKPGIQKLSFDLDARRLSVVHEGPAEKILSLIAPLNFGASLRSSTVANPQAPEAQSAAALQSESRVLKQLLAINGGMFVVEIVLGIFADSTGLIADSLDMLADALVYSLSLYAVGKAAHLQKRFAGLSGYLQIALALGALVEVLRRFVYGSEPHSPLMMGTAFLALVANVSCLALLSKHRSGGVHMKASWIFSTNDVIANMGVILAGLMVFLFKSNLPDLLIGSLIAVIVLRGGFSILKMAKS